MKKQKYKITEILSTLYIVEVGSRREEVRQSMINKHWFSTFNGLTREHQTEREALRYAVEGKCFHTAPILTR